MSSKKVSFYVIQVTCNVIMIFHYFVGLLLRKMADSSEQGTEPSFHEDTDLTTRIEQKKDEFVNWSLEKKRKMCSQTNHSFTKLQNRYR